jgi:hypothetical protein
MGFESALDEDASFPCPGTPVDKKRRCGPSAEATTATKLIATCQPHNRRYEIVLLDVDLNPDPRPHD